MPKYAVRVPIVGHVQFIVDAADGKAAVEVALGKCDDGELMAVEEEAELLMYEAGQVELGFAGDAARAVEITATVQGVEKAE